MNRSNFFEEIREEVSRAGWFPGRAVLLQVTLPSGFVSSEAALRVLDEFGLLHIGSVGPGVDCARSDVLLDPNCADGLDECIKKEGEMLSLDFFPLGAAHRGHAIVMMSRDGVVFLYGEGGVVRVADDFFEALWRILTGRVVPVR